MPGYAFAILVIVCIGVVGFMRRDQTGGDWAAFGDMFSFFGWGAFVVIGILLTLSIQGCIGWK